MTQRSKKPFFDASPAFSGLAHLFRIHIFLPRLLPARPFLSPPFLSPPFPGRLFPTRLFPAPLSPGCIFPGRIFPGRIFPGRIFLGRLFSSYLFLMRLLLAALLYIVPFSSTHAQVVMNLSEYNKIRNDSASYAQSNKSLSEKITAFKKSNDSLSEKLGKDSTAVLERIRAKTDSAKSIDALTLSLTSEKKERSGSLTSYQKKIDKFRKTDSLQYTKNLTLKKDSLEKLQEALVKNEAYSTTLNGKTDSLRLFREDSLKSAARIESLIAKNKEILQKIRQDSLEIINKQAQLAANPDIRENKEWNAFVLNESFHTSLQNAQALLNNAYDPSTCAQAQESLNQQWDNNHFLAPAQKDSVAKYKKLLDGYCALSAECLDVIKNTRSDFNTDQPALAAKEIMDKAKTINPGSYPFLYREMIRLSGQAKTYKGAGKDFVNETTIKSNDCK